MFIFFLLWHKSVMDEFFVLLTLCNLLILLLFFFFFCAVFALHGLVDFASLFYIENPFYGGVFIYMRTKKGEL